MTKTTQNPEMLRALEAQKLDVEREVGALQGELKKVRADRGRVGKELEEAWAQLARTLAPTLQALPVTSSRIALPDVGSGPMYERMQREDARCRDFITTLGTDRAPAQRDELRNVSSRFAWPSSTRTCSRRGQRAQARRRAGVQRAHSNRVRHAGVHGKFW